VDCMTVANSYIIPSVGLETGIWTYCQPCFKGSVTKILPVPLNSNLRRIFSGVSSPTRTGMDKKSYGPKSKA